MRHEPALDRELARKSRLLVATNPRLAGAATLRASPCSLRSRRLGTSRWGRLAVSGLPSLPSGKSSSLASLGLLRKPALLSLANAKSDFAKSATTGSGVVGQWARFGLASLVRSPATD